MATADGLITARRGGGRLKSSKHITLTMAAGATVSDSSFTPPEGSRVAVMRYYTTATFSGSPTNINLRCGSAAAGQQYVADTDVKTANAATALTQVAAADWSSWPASQAMFFQLAANGGTNPAGTVIVEIDYAAPNP